MEKIERLFMRYAGEILYNAAAQTFGLPDWQQLKNFMTGGPLPELPEQFDPFIGPTICPHYTHKGLAGVEVVTNGGRHVFVCPGSAESVQIDFGPNGSLAAAGEILSRTGLACGIEISLVGGQIIDAKEYTGPVDPNLGRARWDRTWRQSNPALSSLVPID